ncbi:universal stress protein [Halorubrum sp. BV1]|uniref:universal stress protein n=1 Tax=Halorubrum sp. BV1 TaxID=1498500 RepID=UPI0006788779|nr:universal stress protein [Halorubrum sp. BV1]
MVEHILVPVDDSDPAIDALDFAVENYPDASITALHVVDPSEFSAAMGIEGAATYSDVVESHEDTAEELLAEMSERVAKRGVSIETEYVVGDVDRSIVEYIDDHDIDHVVIGSHGRSGATRVLLGSVAESVTRRSQVPVTVIR